MARVITVGAAQLGPVAGAESRSQVVKRLVHFARHRQPRHYGLITEGAGAIPPPPGDGRA